MSLRELSIDSPALVRADHPWEDSLLAQLYDLFPFAADLPLYLELAQAQGGRVVEWACGSGRVLVPLARAGHRVLGVDASAAMLAIAEQKLRDTGADTATRARLLRGDMRSLPLGEKFDLAIIAVKSFAYLLTRQEQQRALENVARHLRTGGLLAMDLLNPSPGWLQQPPGSLRQDLVEHAAERGLTLARTEAVVSTDLSRQVRVIRSAYELVDAEGRVTKRFVEWPYRYVFRYEAEHLLERSGFAVEALYGGYARESFESDSSSMVFLARKR